MHASIIAFVFLAIALTSSPQAAEALYHREINEKNPGGKNLQMTVREIRRDEKTSIVKVTFVSGASLPSIMVIVRAWYDIAKDRGAEYFCNLREEDKDGEWTYLVGFSNDGRVNLSKYFKLTEPLSKPNDTHQFMSVKQFDLLFKAQK